MRDGGREAVNVNLNADLREVLRRNAMTGRTYPLYGGKSNSGLSYASEVKATVWAKVGRDGNPVIGSAMQGAKL